MTTARALALDALDRIDPGGAYANLLLPEMLARSDLSERDRGFGVVNPGEIVAVDVDLGHEMRQGHDLAGDHLRRPFYPAGI